VAYADVYVQHLLALLYCDPSVRPFLCNDEGKFVGLLYAQEAYNHKIAGAVTVGPGDYDIPAAPGFRLDALTAEQRAQLLQRMYDRCTEIASQNFMLKNVAAVSGGCNDVTRVFGIGLSQYAVFEPEHAALDLHAEATALYEERPELTALAVLQPPLSASRVPLVSSCTRYNILGNAKFFDSVTLLDSEAASDDIKNAFPSWFVFVSGSIISPFRVQNYQPRACFLYQAAATYLPLNGHPVDECCGNADATATIKRASSLLKGALHDIPAAMHSRGVSSSPFRTEVAVLMRSCSHEPMSKDQVVACFEVAISGACSTRSDRRACTQIIHGIAASTAIICSCAQCSHPGMCIESSGALVGRAGGALWSRSLPPPRDASDGYAAYARIFTTRTFTAACKRLNRNSLILPPGVLTVFCKFVRVVILRVNEQ
jgi:hypothetical protein